MPISLGAINRGHAGQKRPTWPPVVSRGMGSGDLRRETIPRQTARTQQKTCRFASFWHGWQQLPHIGFPDDEQIVVNPRLLGTELLDGADPCRSAFWSWSNQTDSNGSLSENCNATLHFGERFVHGQFSKLMRLHKNGMLVE
jgi:hypothetical protein